MQAGGEQSSVSAAVRLQFEGRLVKAAAIARAQLAELVDAQADPEAVALAHLALGGVLSPLGAPDETVEHGRAAVELLERGGSSAEHLAAAREFLSVAYWNAAMAATEPAVALGLLLDSAHIVADLDPLSKDLLDCHRQIARRYVALHDLPHAEEHQRAAIKILEQTDLESPSVVWALADLGELLIEDNGQDEALATFQRALDIASMPWADDELANALRTRMYEHAAAWFQAGEQADEAKDDFTAAAHYRRAAYAFRMAKNASFELVSLLLAGGKLAGLNELGGSALEDMQRAVELAVELVPGSANHARAHQLVGAVLRDRGRVNEALDRFDQALAVAPADLASPSRAAIYLDIARTRLRARDPNAAQTAIQEALELLLPENQNDLQTASAYAMLAAVLTSQGGSHAEADRNQEAALRILQANGSPPVPTARSLNALGRPAEAIEVLTPHHEDSLPMIVARHALAREAAANGDLARAESLGTALAAQLASTHPVSTARALVLRDLAGWQRQRGHLDDAIASLEQCLQVVEVFREAERSEDVRRELFAELQEPYLDLIACLYERNTGDDRLRTLDIAEQTKARALLEILRMPPGELKAETPEQRDLLQQRDTLRGRLGMALDGAELDRLQRQLEVVGDSIRAAFATEGRVVDSPPPLWAMDRLLGETTLALEYGISADRMFCWALRLGDYAVHSSPVTSAEIADLVEQAVGGYQHGRLTGARERVARQRLSRLLFGGVPAHMWQGIDRLLIVVDGQLVRLPFELLAAPLRGVLIAEAFTVGYAPSLNVALHLEADRRTPSGGPSFVGFGDPPPATSAGLARLGPLPFSGREVTEIAALFDACGDAPTHRFTGPAATEFNVRATVGDARFVHFATHAVIDDEQPMGSGLVLAPPQPNELAVLPYLDDRLRARELPALQLRAEAVVCSACRTANGRWRAGEGLLGFTRAFLIAGARCVVASLWPVRDRTTFEFMRVFYARVIAGASVAEALRHTRLEIRKRRPDPYDWAGFVVIGLGW